MVNKWLLNSNQVYSKPFMKFPSNLPYELRCAWDDIGCQRPDELFAVQWRAVFQFAEKHGVGIQLPEDAPDEVLSDWLRLEGRRDGSSLADQWTAVRYWANKHGYEISIAPYHPPDKPPAF